VLFLLFFLSGFSGLVYQVSWVRQFGTAFGATIHTTSLVVAIFMLGLGAGSSLVGVWADRRYERAPDSLLRAYGVFELLIAGLGLAVSLALPRLQALAAATSSYVKDANGWFVLSTGTYAAQAAIAFVMLAPITLLMGGTLTLLIRHLVRADVKTESGSKIGALYAVNTLGAAAGAFLTDFSLVPAIGLRETEFIAVALNAIAGVGAIVLTRAARPTEAGRYERRRSPVSSVLSRLPNYPIIQLSNSDSEPVLWAALALLLSGFAGMGLEIVWLRHFNVLLGGFRAVFSLVMTVLLAGIAAGALIGGAIARRVASPARALMIVLMLLVLAALYGLSTNSAGAIAAARVAAMPELWFDVKPMLLEIGVPAILLGATFPVGNAAIQHLERTVGRRAGVLYLANTIGAVIGSLAAGYVLLPRFGMQGTATVLALAAGIALAPLYLMSSSSPEARPGGLRVGIVALVVVAAALDVWLRLPESYVLLRALPALAPPEKLTSVREGMTEIVAITERPGLGRALLTNGHAMSSTALLDQRYMRALAHVPLLLREISTTEERRKGGLVVASLRVLVIGFGVGNSTHATTLYTSVQHVDVADLSRQILDLASSFRDANGDVLRDPRVQVFVNDGRQHLEMQPPASYDLITLEPPPIAHAGVGALYSREFYELARTRLKPGGYMSQWLPVYQVPPATSLAMVRAFLDVFPRTVLLSGTQAELLLIGTTADRIEIDPDRLARTLESEPKVADDLRRIGLGGVTEIVGSFLASSDVLARATSMSAAVTEDRPLQEYGVRSVLATNGSGVPAALVDLPSAAKWCPKCFKGDEATVEGLDAYLALMDEMYHSPSSVRLKADATNVDSKYLQAVLPDTDNVHNIIGVTLLQQRRYEEAATEFREALKRREDSPDANRNLGTALIAMGNVEEAITYLQRAVQLAPNNEFAKKELEDAISRSTASRATSSRRPPS
jgi:spermidine synthase